MSKVPADPNALTTTWLTAALRQWGGAGAVNVTDFAMTPLEEGQGFFGQLVRLQLGYAKDDAAEFADAPRTVVAKFSSPTPEMRAHSFASYAREVRFYQQLASATPLPTPICYYADIDLTSGLHVLLLQDLAPLRVGSRVAGCTVDQARVAIRAITTMHLHWWARTDLDEVAWLAGEKMGTNPTKTRQQYDAWWPTFYAQAKAQIPDALITPSQQLGQARAAIRQRVFGDTAASPRTVIHRDFQLDNLFFGAPAADPAFAVVDWQFISCGLGVWDVAYFLSENLLPADRRQVEMALLQAYHQALLAHGIDDYSFAHCYEDYRFALLQRHTALVSTIAAMPFSAAQRHIHINVLLPRNIAALLEHDAFAVIA